MVGVTTDVLKHMSIFFFQGTMSNIVILVFMQEESLKICVIWQLELCYTMLMFLPHLCVCGRSMFRKCFEIEVWCVCVCVCVCGIRYKCLLTLINFVTYVKELHLNPTCNDKFCWMVLIKKCLIMTC